MSYWKTEKGYTSRSYTHKGCLQATDTSLQYILKEFETTSSKDECGDKNVSAEKNFTIETNEGLFEQEAYFNTDPSVFR